MQLKKSPSRRKKNAYPRLGTQDGDEVIGTCDGHGCGKILRRGDPWVTTLSKHLVCRACWQKPVGEWLIGSAILEGNTGKPIDMENVESMIGGEAVDSPQPELVIAEDFGPDNPFF